MAYFAKIENGIVTSTIETDFDTIQSGLVGEPSLFIEYFVNGSSRPAVFGGTYDYTNKQFVNPSPYPSWKLDNNNEWQAPLNKPNDSKNYYWSEEALAWIEKISPV